MTCNRIVVALAPVCFLLVGCTSREVTIRLDQGGKLNLSPAKGDVVHWKDAKGGPKSVKFTFAPTPCAELTPKEKILTGGICTINVDSGWASYKCIGCVDPALDVGSKNFVPAYQPTGYTFSERQSAGVSIPVTVSCSEGTPQIDPESVTIAKSNDEINTVYWRVYLNSSKSLSVKFETATCDPDRELSIADYACVIRKDATNGAHKYTVKTDCGTISSGVVYIP